MTHTHASSANYVKGHKSDDKQETYHNSQGLENVQFAHRTGAMFTQPGIHTGFVENMPVK